MTLHVSVAQWLGATFVECYYEDDLHQRRFVARRKLPYDSPLTALAALRVLRDELPFLEAIEHAHPTR